MASLSRIYIDACCFVEAAKKTTDPDRATDVVFLRKMLEAAENRDIIVHTSVLTVAECYYIPGFSTEEAVELLSAILTSGQCAKILNPTVFTGEMARDLFVKHNIKLKGADALHMASALEKKCDEFITLDGRRSHSPLKNAPALAKLGIRVIRPAQTQVLPSAYRQERLIVEEQDDRGGARSATSRYPQPPQPPATVN